MKHRLYETTDVDRPRVSCDQHGEVVLALCRTCGGAEGSLPTECPGRPLTAGELDHVQAGTLDFVDGIRLLG